MIDRIAAMGDAMLARLVPSVRAAASSHCGPCVCRERIPQGPCIRYGRRCCIGGTTYCPWTSC